MRPEQRPPTAGIAAAACYALLAFAPYAALPSAEAAGLSLYYDFGVAGPQLLSVLALVAVVLFAAGRQRRTEPDFVAGVTLVLGFALAVLALSWALAVPEDVVLQLGEAVWLTYHRWLVVAAAAAVAGSAAWYARALSLV